MVQCTWTICFTDPRQSYTDLWLAYSQIVIQGCTLASAALSTAKGRDQDTFFAFLVWCCVSGLCTTMLGIVTYCTKKLWLLRVYIILSFGAHVFYDFGLVAAVYAWHKYYWDPSYYPILLIVVMGLIIWLKTLEVMNGAYKLRHHDDGKAKLEKPMLESTSYHQMNDDHL